MSDVIIDAIPDLFSLISQLGDRDGYTGKTLEEYNKCKSLFKPTKVDTFANYLENAVWKFGDTAFKDILEDEKLNSIFSKKNSSKANLHEYLVKVIKLVLELVYDEIEKVRYLYFFVPFLKLDEDALKKYLDFINDNKNIEDLANKLTADMSKTCNIEKIKSSKDVYTWFMSDYANFISKNLASDMGSSSRFKNISEVLEYQSKYKSTNKKLKRPRDEDSTEVDKVNKVNKVNKVDKKQKK